jgi:hypothetical protein
VARACATAAARVWCDGGMTDLFGGATDEAHFTDDGSFTCPRCSQRATARFYGPCDACRAELRITFAGEAREVEVAEYVPKMNVTPNAVALKDD